MIPFLCAQIGMQILNEQDQKNLNLKAQEQKNNENKISWPSPESTLDDTLTCQPSKSPIDWFENWVSVSSEDTLEMSIKFMHKKQCLQN